MSESLSELIARRLAELGRRRGGGPMTLKQAHDALPLDDNDKPPISYEIVRRASKGEHTNIGDKAADAIALMLDVTPTEVLTAARKRVRLGRFTLPRRADRLDDKERKTVLAVVDAILDAAEGKGGSGDVAAPDEKSPSGGGLTVVPDDLSEADDSLSVAALETDPSLDQQPGESQEDEV